MGNAYTNTVPTTFDARVIEGMGMTPRDTGFQMVTVPYPWFVTSTTRPVSGNVYIIPARAAGAGPISTIWCNVTAVGNTLTSGVIGIYQIAATGILTLIATSQDFSTGWQSTTGAQTQNLALAQQATVVGGVTQIPLNAGTRHYFGLLCVGTQGPSLAATTLINNATATGNAGAVVNGVASPPFTAVATVATGATVLPGSINLGSASVTVQNQNFYIGAY